MTAFTSASRQLGVISRLARRQARGADSVRQPVVVARRIGYGELDGARDEAARADYEEVDLDHAARGRRIPERRPRHHLRRLRRRRAEARASGHRTIRLRREWLDGWTPPMRL